MSTSPVNDFQPFQNDTQSITVGPGEGLTVENARDRIAIYGELSVANAPSDKAQRDALDDVIAALVKIRATLVAG